MQQIDTNWSYTSSRHLQALVKSGWEKLNRYSLSSSQNQATRIIDSQIRIPDTMIFYLHYILLTSGLSGVSVLLGVFLKAYSDASQGEIGFLLMTFPFVSIIIKPLFCSMADRHQAHRSYLIMSLVVLMIGYAPFAILPFFPEFYTRFPRATWYLLVVSCHIGNGGLGVAWSLGESLAVNMAQRTGTPYSRMRLMGTVSWGIVSRIDIW